jgi:O-antigen/teichoic acid export membrane protein
MGTAQRVAKNTTVLLLNRGLSLGLGVIYIAVLARYIHAEGIGIIATATSLVSMLMLLPNFGLSELIVRDVAGDRAKAGLYFFNAFFLRGLLSIIFAIRLVCFSKIVKYPISTTLIIFIYGLAYIVDALSDVAFSIFNGFEKMEYPATIQTARDLMNIGLSLLAIYMGASLLMIVFISLVANLFKLAMSLVILCWRFVKPRLKIDGPLCRRLLSGALPFAALGMISLVERQIDTALLSFYRPEKEVGWFSAANTLIGYLLLLPAVFLQAIFPVFSKFHTSSIEALKQAYSTTFKYLLILGLALCAGTIVSADQVIALVFGPGFENAAFALRILSFAMLWMVGFANGALLSATGGQNILAGILGVGASLNVVAGIILIPRFGFVGASIAGIISGVAFSFPLTLLCHKRLGIQLPYGLALRSLVASLFMGTSVALGWQLRMNFFVNIFIVAPLIYGVLLFSLRIVGKEDILIFARVFKKRGLINDEKLSASG